MNTMMFALYLWLLQMLGVPTNATPVSDDVVSASGTVRSGHLPPPPAEEEPTAHHRGFISNGF